MVSPSKRTKPPAGNWRDEMNFTPIRDRWNAIRPRTRHIGLTVLVLLMLSLFFIGGGDNAVEVDPAQMVQTDEQYVVQPGEYLIQIAIDHDVPWESVAVANQANLDTMASQRCKGLSKNYTQNPRRTGHYCNDMVEYHGQHMVGLNSLQPGDELIIPHSSHPVVDALIANIPGKRLAIVIDDTGSMTDDQKQVSSWYLRAIDNSGKDIIGVFLYSDGFVREYTHTGQVEFHTTGQVENTRSALETAAKLNPDTIVLVSDEPGDDWNRFASLKLPPVYAHSLDQKSNENLQRVAELTHGQFLRPPLVNLTK